MGVLNKWLVNTCKETKVGSLKWNILMDAWLFKRDMNGVKKALLKKNARFHNIHKGERCFIFGNGPSIGELNFEDFSNEYVFTVNRLMNDDRFSKLKTNYHLWMDEVAYGSREDIKMDLNVYLEEINKLKNEEGLVFFAPLNASEYIHRTGIDDGLDVAYIESFYDFGEFEHIDMCRVTPGFYNVVLYAVELAIYMGFKEIYLLGCENTILISVLNTHLGKSLGKLHAYEEDADFQQKAFKEVIKNSGLKKILLSNYLILDVYEKYKSYCDKNNIKLINLTPETLIDCIDRGDINSILKKG